VIDCGEKLLKVGILRYMAEATSKMEGIRLEPSPLCQDYVTVKTTSFPQFHTFCVQKVAKSMGIYTVSQKNWATFIVTVTLSNVGRF